MAEGMSKSLSVIMPALNEEVSVAAAIGNTLKAFDRYNIYGEIIVINDGSVDGTKKAAEDIMARHPDRVKIINHISRKGIGASFWDGVDASVGNIVCMLPGDNENDPLETLRYIGLLEHVDIVIPFVYNKWARSFFRNTVSFIYRAIINTTFGVNFNYTNGTIIYRKSILNNIRHRSKSFFFQTDILIRLVKRGYLFAEVPYRLGLRGTGSSRAINFPSLMQVARGYLRLVRDIHFSSGERLDEKGFSEDSLSAKRYNANL